jgi:hypothetical protein
MRRHLLMGLAAALAAGCQTGPSDPLPAGGAVVTFTFEASLDTMDVLVLDSVTIRQAEQRVATGVGPRMPVGPIRRGAGIDPRFPFRYDPELVRLGDLATEVCDGRPMKTPTAVDDFIELATGRRNAETAVWCPWGAVPLAVRRRP